MNFDEIRNEWKKDSILDDVDLDKESLVVPQLHMKYMDEFSQINLRLRTEKNNLAKLRKTLWEYYTGKMDPHQSEEIGKDDTFQLKLLGKEIETYILSDDDMCKCLAKIEYWETVKKYVEGIISQLDKRGFQLKAAIDWRKFISGGIT